MSDRTIDAGWEGEESPPTTGSLDALRELHQEARTDVAVLQAALRMAEEGLAAPWEARSRAVAATNRHSAADAALTSRRGYVAPLQAQLGADAARIMRADQRLAAASILFRRLRQRTADRLRSDVASRSALALPGRNAVAQEWDRWVTESTDGGLEAARAAERSAAEQLYAAEAARREAEAWWAQNTPETIEPSTRFREEVESLDYGPVNDDTFDRRVVYERQLEDAQERESSIAAALAADLGSAAVTIGVVSAIAPAVVSAVGSFFDVDDAAAAAAAAAVVRPIASSPAIFGSTEDRTLEQVMGTPLGQLDARVNALVDPEQTSALDSRPDAPTTTLGT